MLPTARDLRFDTLRGLLLVCMTVNHTPSELRLLTDQSVGIFSSAEGFVFISGLLAGWVYTRKYRKGGKPALLAATFKRTKTIYAWHVGAFAACLACVLLVSWLRHTCSLNAPRLFFMSPWESLGLGALLLYQPGLLDLLPMYCAFVLLLPVVISALESGKRWLVLSLSAAIWALSQGMPLTDSGVIYPVMTGSFNVFAWQLLFIAGVTVGFERLNGHEQVSRPNPWVVTAAATLALYCLGIRYLQWPAAWPLKTFGIFLNKPSLGLLRLADFGAIAYFVGILGARFPSLLVYRPLELLGRNSIAVVAAQSVGVLLLLQVPAFSETFTARTLSLLGAVGFLFAVAYARERWSAPGAPRRTEVGPPEPLQANRRTAA